MKTQEGGFNGIADISWAEEYQKKMKGKSNGGKLLKDIYPNYKRTVGKTIYLVEKNKDKVCFIGHTIAERFERYIYESFFN